MNDWMNKVTYDMLPDSQKELADVIGVEATLKLCEVWGGDSSKYIPKNDKVKARLRDMEIRDKFANGNYKVSYIKDQYGLSGQMVRNIVRDDRPVQTKIEDYLQ